MIRRRWRVLECRVRARLWNLSRSVDVGRAVSVGRGVRLIKDREAQLVLGERCEIDDGTTIAVYHQGRVVLGSGSFVGHHSTIAAHELVDIGAHTYLAELVSVRDHDHAVGESPSGADVSVASVIIGADSWIGAKVTVLRGARIGAQCVVGANAVVRGGIPDRTVAVGIPARVVRHLE